MLSEFEALLQNPSPELNLSTNPAPSLREFRSGRGRLIRSLPCYFGQVRLSFALIASATASGLPDNVPGSTSGDDGDLPVPRAKRLLRMPGSTTTRGRQVSCDIDTGRVAFCRTENNSTPNMSTPLNTSLGETWQIALRSLSIFWRCYRRWLSPSGRHQ